MAIKIATGRPSKINYQTMIRLADAVQHNATIGDACRHARISRDTYYRHLNNDPVFERMMRTAMENRNKVVMSFLTTY